MASRKCRACADGIIVVGDFSEIMGGKDERVLDVELSVAPRGRSEKQNRTMWKLITLCWQESCGETRSPTAREKEDTYEALLAEYAPETLNTMTGALRRLRSHELSAAQMAAFIDALMAHLSSLVGLSVGSSLELSRILREVDETRKLGEYEGLSEREFRDLFCYSAAGGETAGLDLHHIISRGAGGDHKPHNWIVLTRAEHSFLHSAGERKFLTRYPHLTFKFEFARLKHEGAI